MRSAVAAAITLGIALLVVNFARFGADWPAQDFRAYIAQHGLSVWSNAWYGGIALPGYSVLYPPLAAVSGSSAVGVASVTLAAWFAAQLGPSRGGLPAVAFCSAVTLCLIDSLVVGQVTFLLGVAFAAGALVALRANRRWWTALGAAGASLGSPLAGLFLVFAALALLRTYGWRRVALLAPALLGSAVTAVTDAGGGPFPYKAPTLEAVAICCGLILLLTDRRDRAVRDFALWYVGISAVLFLFANPVGTNLGRLGKLAVLPLAVLYLVVRTLPPWRRLGVVVGVGLAAYWSLIPLFTSLDNGRHDPGRPVAYYRGLLGFLQTQNPVNGRLEIPFTRTHTESNWVARSFPLARGWERQIDLGENNVLYKPLTPTTYRRWLDKNAVSLVATSTLEPDGGGKPEARLLQHPPSYLQPVWRDDHWRVWRVVNPQPIADGAARLTGLGPASLTLRFDRAGSSVVRVRASPMWEVSAGPASLYRTKDGWLDVRSSSAGGVTLRARVTFALLDPTDRLR